MRDGDRGVRDAPGRGATVGIGRCSAGGTPHTTIAQGHDTRGGPPGAGPPGRRSRPEHGIIDESGVPPAMVARATPRTTTARGYGQPSWRDVICDVSASVARVWTRDAAVPPLP